MNTLEEIKKEIVGCASSELLRWSAVSHAMPTFSHLLSDGTIFPEYYDFLKSVVLGGFFKNPVVPTRLLVCLPPRLSNLFHQYREGVRVKTPEEILRKKIMEQANLLECDFLDYYDEEFPDWDVKPLHKDIPLGTFLDLVKFYTDTRRGYGFDDEGIPENIIQYVPEQLVKDIQEYWALPQSPDNRGKTILDSGQVKVELYGA